MDTSEPVLGFLAHLGIDVGASLSRNVSLRACAPRLPYSLVAQLVKNLPAVQETQARSLGQEDPLEKGMTTHSSLLACRESHGQRSLEGCSRGVTESRTRLGN